MKYHLGTSSDRAFDGNKVHLSLTANPSHLEAVDPVVLGKVRAKQDQHRTGADRTTCCRCCCTAMRPLPVRASWRRCFGLSGLKRPPHWRLDPFHRQQPDRLHDHGRASAAPRRTQRRGEDGPEPHLPRQRRDPGGGAQARRWRWISASASKADVVIDMYCYRRWATTRATSRRSPSRSCTSASPSASPCVDGYLENLREMGVHRQEEADAMVEANARKRLEAELEAAHQPTEPRQGPTGWTRAGRVLGRVWKQTRADSTPRAGPDTGIEKKRGRPAPITARIAEGFNVAPKIERLLKQRLAMIERRGLDWAACELLAFASLAASGHAVRLSGQDCEPRHLQQRHAVLSITTTAALHPLSTSTKTRRRSRSSTRCSRKSRVLGFEYGYSARRAGRARAVGGPVRRFRQQRPGGDRPVHQLGRGQVGRMSGLVMLLPHGYEGRGPEHSSARLERFLSCAAEDNMQVAQPTTPAKMFHLLRRQVIRRSASRLVLMTPKSLLRHPRCVRPRSTTSASGFRRISARPDGGMDAAKDPARSAVLGQGLLRLARGARKTRPR